MLKVTILSILVSMPGFALCQEDRSFDVQTFRTLIDHDIGIPKPGCTLAQMGIPAKPLNGQIVDADGQSLGDVQVAVIEPIGYSTQCYYDNFALTDNDGRFEVAGAARKDRVVFRRNDGWTLVVSRKDVESKPVVVWPASATVNLNIPERLATPGQSLMIRTERYHVGMSTLNRRVSMPASGTLRFDALVPGSYVVLTNKEVSVGESKVSRQIEIGRFTAVPGKMSKIECGLQHRVSVSGQIEAVRANSFIVIEREKLRYEDASTAVDVLRPAADGFFLSRKLPTGIYVARLLAEFERPALGGRFAPVSPATLKTWRFRIDQQTQSVNLNELEDAKSPAADAAGLLEEITQSQFRRRQGGAIQKLKALPNRKSVEQELLRLLSEKDIPHKWRQAIPELLADSAESENVVEGLLQAAKNPVTVFDRRAIIRALGNVTVGTRQAEDLLTDCCSDQDPIARGLAVRMLGELAVRNKDSALRIASVLEQRLNDADESTRATAADYLGRLAQPQSLEPLLARAQDVHGPTAVMSGYGAWKISGNPDHAIHAMNTVLNRSGLLGKWQAAFFLKSVAEKHKLPQDTIRLLETVAAAAEKKNSRTHYDYEVARAAQLAQQTLDSAAQSTSKE